MKCNISLKKENYSKSPWMMIRRSGLDYSSFQIPLKIILRTGKQSAACTSNRFKKYLQSLLVTIAMDKWLESIGRLGFDVQDGSRIMNSPSGDKLRLFDRPCITARL